MDVGALVTRKIGPLPVWAYGAIIVGLAWGYTYFVGRSPLTDITETLPTPDASDTDFPDLSDDAVGNGQGGTSTAPQSGAPSNNQAWYQMASNYLLGFNYEGVAVNNALTKYLIGEPLSVPERALVNQAVSRYGAPPEGVPVSPGGNPQTPNIPPVPGGVGRGGSTVPRRSGPYMKPLIPLSRRRRA